MFADFKKHKAYIFTMLLAVACGIFLSIQTSYDKNLQLGILVATAFLYMLVGIFHHSLEHDISYKIVIEYVLIGSFGTVLLLFFLKGGF